MPKFVMERPLPSMRVTKDMLTRVEAYVLNEATTLLTPRGTPAAATVAITIEDNYGTETLRTISEHHAEPFPSATQRVACRYDLEEGEDSLEIALAFNRTRERSSIRIKCSATSSREIALGIYERLRRVIEPCENPNRWFHFGDASGLIAMACLVGMLFAGDGASKAPSRYVNVALFACGFVAAVAIPKLKPYCAFDSPSQRRADEIGKWFSLGLMSFLVFGTGFALLRQHFLGF